LGHGERKGTKGPKYVRENLKKGKVNEESSKKNGHS